MTGPALEMLFRRDRFVVGSALAALVVAAWVYVLHLASATSGMTMPDMRTMPGMAMPPCTPGAGWKSARSSSCGPS